MQVILIPTGQMELKALPDTLSTIFPGHTFEALPRVRGTTDPFDGFTSSRLPSASFTTLPTNLTRLVETLAATVMPGRGGKPADLAILIDDLELDNADQAPLVVEAVQNAVEKHIDMLREHQPGLVERTITALRERASFHLAVPMIESWLFADPSRLPVAGVPPSRLPPMLLPGDPEQLHTNDPAYAADDGSSCAALLKRNRGKAKPTQPIWVREARERHPKAYLSWLCRDDQERRRCSHYSESHGGAEALRGLDWAQVLHNPEHMTFARALIEDLADGLGQQPRIPLGGAVAALTSRHHLPRAPVLRNL